MTPRPHTGPLGKHTKPFQESGSALALTALVNKKPSPLSKGFETSSINVGIMGTKTYNYWTNFSRMRSEDFEVLTEDPKIPGYWWFETNLEPDDFDLFMSKSTIRSFLYGIVDYYRSPDL